MRQLPFLRRALRAGRASPAAAARSIVAALITVALLFGGGLKAQPPGTTNSVAVVDFELSEAPSATNDWAFGLADMMAVELQQRGVALFERQQIQAVLGERRITAASLTQLENGAGSSIPGLSFLVTGTIRPLTGQRFQLEVTLVEVRTGRNAATFGGNGRYSEDLPQTLASLAEQIAGRLHSASGSSTNAEPAAIHASFRTPEVALLLYKGIAYCEEGRPEMGVTWFIDAEKAVPAFLPARVWEMRAFEALGLTDFAAIARERLREAPNGQGVLNRLNESRFFKPGLISVAVIPDSRLDAASLKLGPQLKNLLAQQTNLFVADPDNIRALAAEMDLQLTEQGAHDLELTSILWSSMDALVTLTADPARPGSVTVQVRDGLSGNILFSDSLNANASNVAPLAGQVAASINTTRVAGSQGLQAAAIQNSGALKPAQVNNTDRAEFAGLLRYLAENPSDGPGWKRLSLFFPWLEDERYRRACVDRSNGTSLPGTNVANLDPNRPEAQYARSIQAMKLVDEKKYAEAARIFLRLIGDLPAFAGQVKIGPDYWANLYFFTAVCLHETGDDDIRARQFLAKADELLRHGYSIDSTIPNR